MANLQAMRRKIASVKNTQKITKARQEAITKELIDIVGGSNALT